MSSQGVVLSRGINEPKLLSRAVAGSKQLSQAQLLIMKPIYLNPITFIIHFYALYCLYFVSNLSEFLTAQ